MDYNSRISSLSAEIPRLESDLAAKRAELTSLLSAVATIAPTPPPLSITKNSSPSEKIRLFRSLFTGRDDVYARRFESARTGKSGYQPACANEWVRGVCEKPRVKCGDCSNRSFIPFTDDTVRTHLLGDERTAGGSKPFVVGVYPLLPDETCRFLAVDFDKSSWEQDVTSFRETCRDEGVPCCLERSRSGNGGHVWFFFDEPIPARIARTFGSALMTKTFDHRPEIGLDSFDRFFPNQDTMPRGGLGNLIALPLQKRARERSHSVFLDETMRPYPDQWAFLTSVRRVARNEVERIAQTAQLHRQVLPVSFDTALSDEECEPWKAQVTNRWPRITEPLPKKVEVVLANQIFIDSTGLPAQLRNRILRLASFSNPEFYQAQAMRLPTWNKPRILCCYEQFPRHIAIPIGCLGDLQALLNHYGIAPVIEDKRTAGTPIDVAFAGNLHPEQLTAATALLREENGILSATTAFGKTVVALWLIAQRKTNALILVHRTQLLDQWVDRIGQFLGVPKKSVGRIGGGRKKRTGLIDVAVIQSVNRKGAVQEWVREYGQIIVDECHHISALSFEQVIRASSARYKLGLSATLTRKDGQHPIVLMNLGPVRYTVSAKKQAAQRTFDHIVKVRQTDFRLESPDSASAPIQDVFRGLWSNDNRNHLVVADIVGAVQEGRRILVLTERTEHLELFRSALAGEVVQLFVLKGGMGKKQVKVILRSIQDFDRSAGMVILATGRYLGEGFDLPDLDTLFLPFPVSWRGTIAQYAGRLHRDSNGKTEVVIRDYVDSQVPVLARMHERRLKGYAAIGYRVEYPEHPVATCRAIGTLGKDVETRGGRPGQGP